MQVFAVPSHGAPLEEQTYDSPVPTGRQVLVRVTHSGVCHTDTHSLAGGYDLGDDQFLSIADRGLTYPAVFGHEIVGEVIAVGVDATDVQVGDSRIVFPWLGCGGCSRCQAGESNMCATSTAIGVFQWGGFATEVLVPDSDYLVDHTGIDPAWAATLACSGVTSYASIRKILPLTDQESVAVIGAGGVGLAAIAMLSHMTEAKIIAVDVNDDNLENASELGAHVTVNSLSLGDESLAQRLGGPIEAVIDFVNSGDTMALGMDVLAKGGTLVPVGLFGGSTLVSTALLPLKVLTIAANYVGNLQELRELVDLARDAELPRVPITEKPLSLDSTVEALTALTEGTAHGRTVLVA